MGRAVDEEPSPWGRPGEPVGLDFELGVAGHLLSVSFLRVALSYFFHLWFTRAVPSVWMVLPLFLQQSNWLLIL